MYYLLAFIMAFAGVVALRAPLTRLARRLDFLDKPTERKNHKTPAPLIGGVAMFASFTLGFVVFLGVADARYAAILLGSLLILGIGLVDDWHKTKGREFAALPRAVVHVSASVIAYASGIRFTGFMNPFTDSYVLLPPWLQFVLTIMWIFGVTTVINWSDGVDCLAGGLSALSGLTFFVAALMLGQTDSAFMAALLVGAALGFLKYNYFPAKIFMGDSGANFLGFILAVVSLHGAFKQATVISVFAPVLALGLPIFDNLFVVLRRFLNKQPLYGADASQLHHRLLRTGLKPKQVVTFLMLLSACLNLTSIIILLIA